ncbi:hypothetical protein D3C85_1859240 [compost metagenome]
MVGMLLAMSERLLVDSPREIRRPDLTWGKAVMMVSKYMDTWPAIKAGMASPAPL